MTWTLSAPPLAAPHRRISHGCVSELPQTGGMTLVCCVIFYCCSQSSSQSPGPQMMKDPLSSWVALLWEPLKALYFTPCRNWKWFGIFPFTFVKYHILFQRASTLNTCFWLGTNEKGNPRGKLLTSFLANDQMAGNKYVFFQSCMWLVSSFFHSSLHCCSWCLSLQPKFA